MALGRPSLLSRPLFVTCTARRVDSDVSEFLLNILGLLTSVFIVVILAVDGSFFLPPEGALLPKQEALGKAEFQLIVDTLIDKILIKTKNSCAALRICGILNKPFQLKKISSRNPLEFFCCSHGVTPPSWTSWGFCRMRTLRASAQGSWRVKASSPPARFPGISSFSLCSSLLSPSSCRVPIPLVIFITCFPLY